MEHKMPDQKSDDLAYLKIAQLLAASDLQSPLCDRYIEQILHKEGNINFQISANTILGSTNPDLLGCTVLHLAYRRNKLQLFNFLLKYGADYTAINQSSSTVLHEIIQDVYDKEAESTELKAISDNPFVTSVFDVLVKSGDFWNSRSKRGISHFHIACMANHKVAVEHFLKTAVLIDQAVFKESSIFPGYTAIHFAARFANLDTVKILLEHGAAHNIMDAKGMTPLHILLRSNIEIAGLLNKNEVVNAEHLISRRKTNEDIICLLLGKIPEEVFVIDDTNLTRLHIDCIMESSKIRGEQLTSRTYLDQAVNDKSSIFAGNTALHFAALCNVDKVKLLLNNRANIRLLNAKKETAFGLCINRYHLKDIHDIISSQPKWKTVELPLINTTILDMVLCLQTLDLSPFLTSSGFIQHIFVHKKSSIWPTYNLLHVAVLFSERDCKNDSMVIEKILQQSPKTSINHSAKHGIRALQLAFRMKKVKTVNFLLTCNIGHNNLWDSDELSYLHIACAAGDSDTVKKFLLNNADVNAPILNSYEWYTHLKPATTNSNLRREVYIPKGSTPLHIAVIVGNCEMMKLLMDHGANIYAEDEHGMTPIHWLLISDNPISPAADVLFSASKPISKTSSVNSNKRLTTSSVIKECITSSGLSHLHVACFANDVTAVEQLLKVGSSKVNGKLFCTVEDDSKLFPGEVRYANYTPLQFALEGKNDKIVSLLIEHGADVLIENSIKKSIPLIEAFNDKSTPCFDVIISFFKNNEMLQKQLEERLGLTMLHFYCYSLNYKAAVKILKKESFNVNNSIQESSPIWPGYTPLHVLMKYYQSSNKNADSLFGLLLGFGADVTALNTEKNTPLHLAYNLDIETRLKDTILKTLLRHRTNFSMNPRSSNGLSHFHVACAFNDMNVIEKFLENKVDVNQPVDFFYGDNELRGSTPLHLILFHPFNRNILMVVKHKAVSLLIQSGANLGAENAFGNTALHLAAKYLTNDISLLAEIVDWGGDMWAKNILGETPFEIMLNSEDVTIPSIQFFLNRGYFANSFNLITQKGFVAMTFSSHSCRTFEEQKPIIDLMVKACGNMLDYMGRTVIHNIVSTSLPVFSRKHYLSVIESLEKTVNIDHQDNLGRTALHIATQFKNHRAVSALLQAGADINILDANDKTAFTYAFEISTVFEAPQDNSEKIIKIFSAYVKKLKACKLHVAEKNRSALTKALKNYDVDANVTESFYDELILMRNLKIEYTSLTLLDVVIGKNLGFVSSCTSKLKLQIVKHYMLDNLFETINKARFRESLGIIRLQCRKFFKEAVNHH